MEIIKIINQVLYAIKSCDTCGYKNLKNKNHNGHCYIFEDKPESCGAYRATNNPLRTLIESQLKED